MKIYVAGHRGMVGSAIVRKLEASGITPLMSSRDQLDLTEQANVRQFLERERPDAVIVAAAKVGGIQANNSQPADFIYQNLMIEANLIHGSFLAGVDRLLFLGSSCIYPRDTIQPIKEESLLTGKLEATNEPYAIAKIAGIKLCESYNRQYGTDYRSIMPTNLYGPGDNFHEANSHVIPALLSRFHVAGQSGADSVVIWGTGTPRREFLHVDDMAAASLFVLNLPKETLSTINDPMLSHINVGTGRDISIKDLAETIARVTGFSGRILFDHSKPDGTPQKLLDVSRLTEMGWGAKIGLEEGINQTYEWFVKNQGCLRGS